jgi:hypothetical protein
MWLRWFGQHMRENGEIMRNLLDESDRSFTLSSAARVLFVLVFLW